jgi:hypothetical protein
MILLFSFFLLIGISKKRRLITAFSYETTSRLES